MNKAVVTLAISTVILSASTAWLAHELYLRDSAAANPAATAARLAASSGALPSHATPGMNGAPPRDGSPATATLPVITNAAPSAGSTTPAFSGTKDVDADPAAPFARQLLARYDDANQRPVLLEEQRSLMRRQYEKLKERLKLGDTEFEQLVSLLAEEQLQMQVNWARCATDPACDPKNPRNTSIDRTQEYQAMLGAEGAEAFAQFRKSIGERDAVIQLRGRLPDSSFLPESQAEKLVMALTEERERFAQESQARGARMSAFGTQLGMLWYTEDSGLPDQYIAEAAQYSQRLRARAASVLTPAQLAAYVQMQEELLAQFTANVRPPPPRQRKSTVVRSS
jgi:hypothetical protein